jgi:2'-5' RNA ligase
MVKRYSIAIYPTSEVMKKVEAMKQQLSSSIGWYHSKNAKAHITICGFHADDRTEISGIKSQLRNICYSEPALALEFNHIEKYNNGAVCILPTNSAKSVLIKLMNRVQKNLSIRSAYKSNNPHISIARKLDNDQSAIANQLFADPDINFSCNSIVLRVYDPQRKQYVVTDEFILENKPLPPDEQLSLF